jgi:5-formyltetrahydrofolate cyclo-ligase
MTKLEIRKIKILKRKSLSGKFRSSASHNIAQKLFKSSVFKNAQIIHIYNSTEFEVNTGLIIQKCFELNKRVVVPVTSSDCLLIEHYEINRETVFEVSYFGISVPIQNYTKFNVSQLSSTDLIVVPMVGFDQLGSRVGYGKGCYDRILQDVNCQTFGLAFDCQKVNLIDINTFDVGLNCILTESSFEYTF